MLNQRMTDPEGKFPSRGRVLTFSKMIASPRLGCALMAS